MSTQKNNNTNLDNKGSEIQNDKTIKENTSLHTHEGKRSGFNEDADQVNNPPGRKRHLVDPDSEAGDENYEDEETEDDDYYEKVHRKNQDVEDENLRESYKEYEGYGDEDVLDKP